MRTIINYGTFQPILFSGAYCFLKFVQPEVGGDFLKRKHLKCERRRGQKRGDKKKRTRARAAYGEGYPLYGLIFRLIAQPVIIEESINLRTTGPTRSVRAAPRGQRESYH